MTDAITIQNPRNRGGSTGHVLAKRSVTFTEIRSGAKMLGVMASMAVPGMENAHALSLGAGSPPPVPDDTNSTTQANGAESATEPTEAESNVIRPASDASLATSRLASLNVPGTASNKDPSEK